MRRAILAGIAAAGLAAPAGAGTVVQFYISGSCTSGCANSGLGDGDLVSGNLQIDSANFTPGGQFLPTDIKFFIFSFGSTWLEFPGPGTSTPVGAWYGIGTWGSTNAEIASLLFNAGPAYGGGYGPGIAIEFNDDGSDTIFTSLNTICGSSLCDTMSPINGSFTGPPTVTWEGEPGPAPIVPLPSALVLAASGLAGLGALRLRRRGAAAA